MSREFHENPNRFASESTAAWESPCEEWTFGDFVGLGGCVLNTGEIFGCGYSTEYSV